jgi:hypothetical protein
VATQTKTLNGWEGCRFEIDYDDATLYLTALRCVNMTAFPAYGTATQVLSGRTRTATFPANQTTTISIPTGGAQRLQLQLDGRGRLDGVDYSFWW